MDAGNAVEWVGAIGTAGALGFTAYVVGTQARERRTEQARQVAAWYEREPVTERWFVHTRNASTEPIWGAVVFYSSEVGAFQQVYEVVPPGDTESWDVHDLNVKAACFDQCPRGRVWRWVLYGGMAGVGALAAFGGVTLTALKAVRRSGRPPGPYPPPQWGE